jgi:uncharacterized protein (UPF0333 family)
MKHVKSIFIFESKGDTWKVEYSYKTVVEQCLQIQHSYYKLICKIFIMYSGRLTYDLYYEFEEIPYTVTINPTKTQAKQLITSAKKIVKNGSIK